MRVKMIQNLRNRMEKIQETFNKDLEELKNKQTMTNNTKNEIKNSLEGINSRITEAPGWGGVWVVTCTSTQDSWWQREQC